MNLKLNFYKHFSTLIDIEHITQEVIWATINRPEARNAINFETISELENLVASIKENSQIRVFILSGSGTQSFIAGGDLKVFHSVVKKEAAIEVSKRMQQLFNNIEQLPCWNIAYVNGDAYGGGIETMMAFDFILSAEHAKFGFTQGRFYLTPGWGGLTRLIERVSRSKAIEWQAKAEVKTAHEMLENGFINSIASKREVLEWAKPLTKNGRDFIQTLKANSNVACPKRLKRMTNEIEPFAELWVNENHTSRVEKFINKGK